MMDEDLLTTTKSRLAGLQTQEQTLQGLLYKFVASHISLYLNLKSPSVRLSQLPSIVHQRILNEVTKFVVDPESPRLQTKDQRDVDVIIEAVKQLLNGGGTKSFDYTWLMAFSPAISRVRSVEQVLEMVAANAPNISTLTLQAEHSWYSACQHPTEFSFTPSMLASVGTMISLHTLQLKQYQIKFHDLLELVTRIPNLTNLNIQIHFLRHFKVDTEAIQKSLPNLKIFLFSVFVEVPGKRRRDSDEDSKKFAEICIQNLPGLEVVGSWISPYASYGLKSNELVGVKSPSSLRQLPVGYSSHANKAADWSTLFPCVTDLEISRAGVFSSLPMDEEATRCAPFLQFTRLVSLQLWSPSVGMVRCFTNRYGPHLHTLNLLGDLRSGVVGQFSFKEIFTSCPNLTDLHLREVDLVEDAEPFDQYHLFASLKKLCLFLSAIDHPVVLSHILSAPYLQEVELRYLKIDAKEVELLSQMVVNQQIFRELKSFKMKFVLERQQGVEIFKQYCQLVKDVCSYSPQLVEVEFFAVALRNFPGEPEVIYPQQPPKYTQAEIFLKLGEPKMLEFLAAFKAR